VRDQYYRQARRRDFDADGDPYRPQARAFGSRPQYSRMVVDAPSGPPLRGVVKWFNPDKGFGFVQLADGTGDAFLHANVLAQSGIEAVQPGEALELRVGPGHKGPHVTQVLSADSSTAPRRSSFPGASARSPSTLAVDQAGTVKWFNLEKGYGFIALADTKQDLFVHVSALERSGLTSLSEGQQVVVDIGEGRKGPEAARVRLA
jgi:CspA family cold shock protein